MDLEVVTHDDVSVLRFAGKMTIDIGDVLLREVFGDLLHGGNRFFVFDLRSLTSMDSAGLGEIIACHKAAKDLGGSIRIVLDEPSRISEFFATAHLNRVFELFADADSALTGFGVGTPTR